MAAFEQAFSVLGIVCMIILGILICFCLARAIKGPSIADRIVGINMIGTMTIMIIAILACVKKNEGYLIDVSLIYAMISFLAVVVLTKVYMGVYNEKKKQDALTAKDVLDMPQNENVVVDTNKELQKKDSRKSGEANA